MRIWAIYQAGYLIFKNIDTGQNSIRVPSLIERIFFSTLEVKIELENGRELFWLKKGDLTDFLEKNEINISPYASETELTDLFHQFVRYPQIVKAKHRPQLLLGKYLGGRIKLDIWRLDSNDQGIKEASLFEWLFTKTVKLPIWNGKNIFTYYVKKEELIEKLKIHQVRVDAQISNENLLDKIRALAILPLNAFKNGLIMNELLGDFFYTHSAESYTKAGKKIEGTAKNKLHFISKWAPSPKLALKTYEGLEEKEFAKNLLLIQVFQKKYQLSTYIDADALAQRFHLPLEEVKASAKKGELEAYLRSKEAHLANLEVMLSNYARLFEKQRFFEKSGLTPEVLMKMIRAFAKRGREGRNPILEKKPYLNGQKYIGLFRGEKLYMANITALKRINEGAFIAATRVYNPISRREKVLKITKTHHSEIGQAQQALKNEYDFLHNLHRGFPGRKIPGIQKAPYAMINCEQGREKQGFLLAPKYIGDTFDYDYANIMSDEEVIHALYKLLKGFEYCVKKKNLGHGDIKPENLLIRKVGQTYEIDLSDFGGARILGHDQSLGTFTPNYFPYNDLFLLQEYGTGDPDNQELFDYYFKLRDAYALGSSMYFILSGGHEPYRLKEYDQTAYCPYGEELIARSETFAPGRHPPPEADFDRETLQLKGISPEMIELIERMVQLNPNERIDIHQAAKKFDAYMALKGNMLKLY
ncbi:serine/threonine-protein kinase [Parachlamydia sp. AcF125]|uniref:serine/threonine-protein kinase n=1 Tax=Parachlamydia sp. AcF125 TaxID=2795736 RepID=UPI001BD82868|nr:serine/threonine-protein kinase [Parachlamydia sp. AcF125]MBS4168321.1 hypothetical protein [Parachlamydia sp. AcF125]